MNKLETKLETGDKNVGPNFQEPCDARLVTCHWVSFFLFSMNRFRAYVLTRFNEYVRVLVYVAVMLPFWAWCAQGSILPPWYMAPSKSTLTVVMLVLQILIGITVCFLFANWWSRVPTCLTYVYFGGVLALLIVTSIVSSSSCYYLEVLKSNVSFYSTWPPPPAAFQKPCLGLPRHSIQSLALSLDNRMIRAISDYSAVYYYDGPTSLDKVPGVFEDDWIIAQVLINNTRSMDQILLQTMAQFSKFENEPIPLGKCSFADELQLASHHCRLTSFPHLAVFFVLLPVALEFMIVWLTTDYPQYLAHLRQQGGRPVRRRPMPLVGEPLPLPPLRHQGQDQGQDQDQGQEGQEGVVAV